MSPPVSASITQSLAWALGPRTSVLAVIRDCSDWPIIVAIGRLSIISDLTS